MAFTVTATQSGSSVGTGVYLLVRVLTGATEAGGASGGLGNATGPAKGSITPNGTNSAVLFVAAEDNTTAVMGTAAANCTYDYNNFNSASAWSAAQGHYTGTVTAGTGVTTGENAASGSGDHWNWCAYEVLSSGGSTPAVDASSPAGVNTGSGTTITTASFTPPNGAVLVAQVTAGGSGAGSGVTMTITDTSGLGLTWTRRAVSSTSDPDQPCWIYTATYNATTAKSGSDTAHAAEAGSVPNRPNGADTAHGAEAGSVHATVPGADPAHAAEHASIPRYPVALSSGSGSSRWLVDQFGKPIMMVNDDLWGLPTNAGAYTNTYQQDFDVYFSTRAAQGYTGCMVNVFGHTHTGGNNDLGHTWDGVFPFLVSGTAANLTGQAGTITLNSTFWTRIDYMFSSAAEHGITVWPNFTLTCNMPCGVNHAFTNGVFFNASTTQIQAAATLIAARYASTPNLVWFQGDDYFNDDNTNMNAVQTGLTSADSRASTFTSIEMYPTGCTSRYDFSIATGSQTAFPWGSANATLNWVYSYMQPYYGIEYAYQEPSPIPVVWGDGLYWGDGANNTQNDQLIRNNVWWALASGARGVVIADDNTQHWTSTSQAALTGDSTWFTTSVKAIRTLFEGLPNWYKLVPDTSSALVTAGRGTRAAYNANEYLANTDTYVAASRVSDGSLAVIYCAAAMSITIDQTKMLTGYSAYWVDPASAATTSVSTGSTYSASSLGTNSAGGNDWALVLQGPPTVNLSGADPASGAEPSAGAYKVGVGRPVTARGWVS